MAKLSEKFKPGDRVSFNLFGDDEEGTVLGERDAFTMQGFGFTTVKECVDSLGAFVNPVVCLHVSADRYECLFEKDVSLVTGKFSVNPYGQAIKIHPGIFENITDSGCLSWPSFKPSQSPAPTHTHSWKPYYGLSNFVQGYDCECGEKKGRE